MHPTSDDAAPTPATNTPSDAVTADDVTASPPESSQAPTAHDDAALLDDALDDDTTAQKSTASAFRLGFTPGVNPAKWVAMWRERRAEPLQLVPLDVLDNGAQVHSGAVHAALVRLPIDRTDLDAIALYDEVPVVIVPIDHLITAADEITLDDLADEVLLHPLDDLLEWEQRPGTPARDRPATTADAVALVAAGIGVLVAPMSLARVHHRRDLTYRPVVDGPTSGIALVWTQYETTEQIEAFIGIVRGRTPNSSRGQSPAAPVAAVPDVDRDASQRPAQPARGKAGNKPGAKGKTTAGGRGLPPRNPGRKPKPGKAGRKGKGKGRN